MAPHFPQQRLVDAFTVVGTTSTGTITGNYSQDFTLANGTASCVLSTIYATKNGLSLTGTLVRRYRLTPCSVGPTAGGEWPITYTFTATRLP